MKNPIDNSLVRFCEVGGLCAFIDWATFTALCTIVPYRLAVVAGFAVSFVVNYWLTAKWTFKKEMSTQKFAGMLGAHLINLFVVRMGVLYILVELVAIEESVAYIPTLIIAALTSYLMVKYVFKR